ncbi:EipA family protein [Niveibacterium sp. 24ML]|uniref:EipA family protein n=1 Tax=Niveibacterium sp. 24ML TaxID=2985512 RepID=UPI00226FFCCD|nr:EipA family protein [Niveibacterium sp. 24ML]MCX9156825.1 EipA family protein [Niveibacterium sp. 24ML]
MLQSYRKAAGHIMLALALLAGGPAFAADAKQPVGKVSIEEKQFGLILGGSSGTGTLTFQGKKHSFKLGGMSVGLNAGASKMSAVGNVYELTDIAQFPGTYTKLDASVALGGGVGAIQLKNENGVIMTLTSRTKGLDVNLGKITGLTIKME